MKNSLREKLSAGQRPLGTFYELGSATAVEALGFAGLDYLIIDTEHGPFDVESTMEFVRAAERHEITPVVRVKEISRSAVLKNLDVGAQGLIVPCVKTIDEINALVSWAKYPPLGERGFFYSRTSGYGTADFAATVDEYFATCNRESMLIPQCETAGALEDIEQIAATDGVDGIFVGPYDLSLAMGIPGQLDEPEFVAALHRIVKACQDAGKPSFIFSSAPDRIVEYYEMGFNSVAVGTDVNVLINGFRALKSQS